MSAVVRDFGALAMNITEYVTLYPLRAQRIVRRACRVQLYVTDIIEDTIVLNHWHGLCSIDSRARNDRNLNESQFCHPHFYTDSFVQCSAHGR